MHSLGVPLLSLFPKRPFESSRRQRRELIEFGQQCRLVALLRTIFVAEYVKLFLRAQYEADKRLPHNWFRFLIEFGKAHLRLTQ